MWRERAGTKRGGAISPALLATWRRPRLKSDLAPILVVPPVAVVESPDLVLAPRLIEVAIVSVAIVSGVVVDVEVVVVLNSVQIVVKVAAGLERFHKM
jgi:hypothetical protein